MTDGTGTTSYNYDPLERLDSTTTGAHNTTGYGYDLDGNVTSITYPNSDVVTYTYNGAGAVSQVADGLGHTTTYAYDPDGNQTSEMLPNGDSSTQTVDNAGRLTGISDAPTTAPSSPFATFDVTRNADGQVATETDTGAAPVSQSYSYDQISRLTSSSTGSYDYDPAGNPTQLPHGVTQTFNAADHLTSSSTPGTAVPPVVSSVSASAGETSATVTWTTDVAASGYVEAGPASGGYPIAVGSATPTASHSVTLSGLVCGVTYHYIVVSAIGAAATTSSDATFSTSACSSGNGITLVGTTTATDGGGDNTLNVTLPSGLEANDELVVTVTTAESVTPATPAGWTAVSDATGGNSWDPRVMIFAKTATGSETTFSTDLGGYDAAEASAAVYRGVDPSHPIDTTANTWSEASTLTFGPITAAVPGEKMVLAEGAECNSSPESWTAPTGYIQQADDNTSSGISSALADVTLPTNGSSGSPVATFGASACLTGTILALRPQGSVTTAYSYDTMGNRTSVTINGGPPTTLGYDQVGHLVSYGSSASYAYNGDGLRMSKTVGSTTTQETWDALGSSPELLLDGSTYYVYGPNGLPLEQINGSTVLYYLHDQLGSTRLLTSSVGGIRRHQRVRSIRRLSRSDRV